MQRRETWKEQVNRVFDMHREQFADIEGIEQYIAEAEAAVMRKEVLGSQRILQFGGKPIFKHNARGYNCGFGHINRVRAFQELMYLLLCGCGIGFSVQEHHVAELPYIQRVDKFDTAIFAVPDTIEGWADAIGVIMTSYLGDNPDFQEYYGKSVTFDYSQIRPEGAPLSSGTKAPGPDGLRRSIEKIREVLERRVGTQETTPIRPIDVYDVIMHAADAVISGGVRRSATIALFSPEDEEMATAKTGAWFMENPQRGRSNNSALLVRNKTTKAQFDKLMKSVREFGEPGFVWAESTEMGFNPCVEIGLYPVDVETGKSGWQFCNLAEINGKKANTPEKFYDACRAASIIGTLQAAYTNFPYVGETTENITRREALLGVSVTGLMDNPDVLFDADVQKQGAEIVKQTNAHIADILGINHAAIRLLVFTRIMLSDTSAEFRQMFKKTQFNTSSSSIREQLNNLFGIQTESQKSSLSFVKFQSEQRQRIKLMLTSFLKVSRQLSRTGFLTEQTRNSVPNPGFHTMFLTPFMFAKTNGNLLQTTFMKTAHTSQVSLSSQHLATRTIHRLHSVPFLIQLIF
jgi:ribonucleoside-diphosphate reductase alpha chain